MNKKLPGLADEHFAKAVDLMPRLWIVRVRMAQLDRKRAETDNARAVADAKVKQLIDEAKKFFQDRLKTAARDPDTLVLAAEAHMLGGEFERALEILAPAAHLKGREEAMKRALAQICVEWANSEGSTPKEASVDYLKRLKMALDFQPENRLAIQSLSAISRAKGPQAGAATAMLDEILTRKPPSPTALFVAGTSAWAAGDKAEARRLLEQAYKVDPTLVDLPNNLAWVLSHSEPEDLPRALTLVDEALRESPDHPNYRGTRGHLMARMKRWTEAKTDLEQALKFREDADNRRVLNETYKELGLRGPGATDPKEL
jgi:tetratricopeptide (TPR) repeat protein